MNLEETREFYKFLQSGKQPNGFKLNEVPTLTGDCAFSIIYLLQEHYKVIPEYNLCQVCKDLYDSSGVESDSAMIYSDGDLIEYYPLEVLEKHESREFCSMECLFSFLDNLDGGNDD